MRKFSCALLIMIILLYAGQISAKEQPMIYIDLWNSTLYLIQKDKVVEQFKISGGTRDSPTPIGVFKVTEKSRDWGGGFGTRWIGLNVPWGKYGIHGTNKPWLIGQDVSNGCVRMFNHDVERLYEQVSIGTLVHIDGPIGGTGESEFKPLSEGSKGTLVQVVQQQLKAQGFYEGKIDGTFDKKTKKAVERFQKKNNLPVTGGITTVEYNLLGILE